MGYRYLNILFHILVWVSIYLVLGFFFTIEPLSKLVIMLFLLYGTLISVFIFYSYAHATLPRYIVKPQISYLVISNLSFLFGFSLFESILDYLFFLPYLGFDVALFPELIANPQVSNFLTFLAINLPMNAAILLAANFYGFSYNFFKVKKAKNEIEKEKLKAELSALKHQINPHFLFNALNALYGMAFENDDEPTAEGIAKLSNMMRYMLYESNGNEVPLSREIDYIKNYIELQKLRVNESVSIIFDVQGDPEGHVIAPMIFLPFVENAFKHGISTIHPSLVSIQVRIDHNTLTFKVHNSKHPPSSPVNKSHSGIGLTNVKKRLGLLCAHCHELEIKDQEDVFSILLTMDLQKKPLRSFVPEGGSRGTNRNISSGN